MARITNYSILSTVASGDLIPISDTSDANNTLFNVTAGTLSTFFNENGVWTPITGGINYSGGNVGIGTTTPTGYLDIQQTNVANDETRGANIDVTKENTSGAGFASNIYGIKSYGKGNSAETIVNIGGVWSKAEHTGTGLVYYITGGTNRGYHNGTGNSTTVTGTFSEARIDGTGVGAHQYVMGVNSIAELDNANATVQYLQGQHCSVKLVDGTVTNNATSLLLDFDYTGTGTITGDFEYLRIQNDTLPAITGTSRAINSLSTLPSVFAGNIESARFIKTGGTSSEYLMADGSVTTGGGGSSPWDTVTGGINYASGNVGIGETSPSAPLHINNNSIDDTILLESTDASSSASPVITMFKNSASPADGDYLGQLKFKGESDTGVTRIFAKITAKTSDVTNTTEDGLIETAVRNNGSNLIVSRQTGDALKLINSVGLEVDGDVGIGTSSPAYKLDVTGEGRFTSTLTCQTLVQTSQRDQKKDISDINKNKATKIEFKEYKYKAEAGERKRYGVVVEDIEAHYPELVHTGADGIKGVNYIDLLVKRVAELEKEIEDSNHLSNVKSIAFNSKTNKLEVAIGEEVFSFTPDPSSPIKGK